MRTQKPQENNIKFDLWRPLTDCAVVLFVVVAASIAAAVAVVYRFTLLISKEMTYNGQQAALSRQSERAAESTECSRLWARQLLALFIGPAHASCVSTQIHTNTHTDTYKQCK